MKIHPLARTVPDRHTLSRRDFLTAAAVTTAAVATGCATNPVTGQRQFMFVSEADELNMDRQTAPHLFSGDYGATKDQELNRYLSEFGYRMAALTHRPHVPYNFRVLNAVYVNAYTLPGGSMGFTRSIMLMLNDEAELAALMGHELAHVNHRHLGERKTKEVLTMIAVGAITAAVAQEKAKYAAVTAGLGMMGSYLLLNRYSRDNEREADSTGMGYAVKAGYDPRGMVRLMDGLRKTEKEKPSAISILFSTHPMSDERYETAVKRAIESYPNAPSETQRERYMDNTARLRAKSAAIKKFQDAEAALLGDKFPKGEALAREGLQMAPDDYAGLLLMAKCHLAQEKPGLAKLRAEEAKQIYPSEPQAVHLSGVASLQLERFDSALMEFESYDKALPGNTNTVFFIGLCNEKMGRRPKAADAYMKYLEEDPGGEFAQHARECLIAWGYIQPPPQEPAATDKAPQ